MHAASPLTLLNQKIFSDRRQEAPDHIPSK